MLEFILAFSLVASSVGGGLYLLFQLFLEQHLAFEASRRALNVLHQKTIPAPILRGTEFSTSNVDRWLASEAWIRGRKANVRLRK